MPVVVKCESRLHYLNNNAAALLCAVVHFQQRWTSVSAEQRPEIEVDCRNQAS